MQDNENDLPMEDDSDSVDNELNRESPADSFDESDGEDNSDVREDDPYGVKKRLGKQAKKHRREMRAMQEQMQAMQQQLQDAYSPHQMAPSSSDSMNKPMNDEDRIQRAVSMALQAKDEQSKQAQREEQARQMQRLYENLQNQLDKGSEKYDDFEDVVRSNDAPFTNHIRDALLLISNPEEVAYKLGKNRDELSRISKLNPIEQAREVNKLSFALMGGNRDSSSNQQADLLSAKRPNPANNSSAISNKTPASVIRQRMKQGTWK